MGSIDVEAALRWAFRDELAKAGTRRAGGITSSWGLIASYAETLIRAQPNRFGLTPNLAVDGEPDPDAVAIGEAVMALDRTPVVVPEGWDPAGDLDLGDLEAGLMRAATARALAAMAVRDAGGEWVFREKPSRIVTRYALMRVGSSPDWAIDRPVARPIVHESNGKPRWFRKIEVWEGDERGNPEFGCWRTIVQDGWDLKRRQPYPDAYLEFILDPDPSVGIEGRIEYEVWRDCLDVLVSALAGKTTCRIGPSRRPARPWETGREPRVLAAIGGA